MQRPFLPVAKSYRCPTYLLGVLFLATFASAESQSQVIGEPISEVSPVEQPEEREVLLPSPRFLAATPFVDKDHPEIRAQVARLVRQNAEPWENAVAIHDFVRDEIEYGFGPRFYEHKASEVLDHGRGFCNSKSTLFVAMLRAAGIPARQRFVEIEPPILYGIVDAGTPWLDHTFTEVWLDGTWVAVDSYNVDPELNRGARIRLQREKKEQGYGVHSSGTIRWDGKTNSFSQFVSGLEQPVFGSRDMGVYDDVFEFYESSEMAWNSMEPGMRTFFPIAAVIMNRKLDRVRKTGVGFFERRDLMRSSGFRRFRSKP